MITLETNQTGRMVLVHVSFEPRGYVIIISQHASFAVEPRLVITKKRRFLNVKIEGECENVEMISVVQDWLKIAKRIIKDNPWSLDDLMEGTRRPADNKLFLVK